MTFVSHLDVCRAFTRALVKSGLPVYYTEGFNPIPKLTFASPLSVGVSGEAEFVQFKLVQEIADAQVLEALSQAIPSDIELREVYTPQIPFREIAWAENQIDFYVPAAEEMLPSLVFRFDGPVVVKKKTKSSEKETDIRPLIRDIRFSRFAGGVRAVAITRADSADYLNPVYVARVCMSVLGPEEKGYYTIRRRQLLLEDGSAFR